MKEFTGSFLNSGKLRVSYGALVITVVLADMNNSKHSHGKSLYYLAAAVSRGFVNSKLMNQFLTWEETTVFNAGIELGIS